MVSVGRILRSHDKSGEVKLRLFELESLNLDGVVSVFIGRGGSVREFQVESVRPCGKDFILKLAGVDSLSQADGLVGMDLRLAESALAELDEGHYYVYELVGCRVVTQGGDDLGRVSDVIFQGEGSLLAVDSGGKEVLIPFQEAFCKGIDLAAREIRVDLPEGLLDLNES